MQLNFDAFDHQMKVKVAEILLGLLPPQAPNPPGVGPKNTSSTK